MNTLPPAMPVRSLEFYYTDGNIVFQVRTPLFSPHRDTLTECMLSTGFQRALSAS